MYHDPYKELQRRVNLMDRHLTAKKRAKKGKNLYKGKPVMCPHCKRGMSAYMASEQIKNEREDAPICMACIMGYKRINIEEAREKFLAKNSPETLKARTEHCKEYNKKNK